MPRADCWVYGAVAQLGERLVCNQEATGSIPVSSTKFWQAGGQMEWMEGLGPLVELAVVIIIVLLMMLMARMLLNKDPAQKK
jgi:hypothetical protein